MSAVAPPRTLGAWSLYALGLNGIVGVGIFFAPSEIAGALPGPAGALVYPLTALALLPVALAYSRLGARFDEDGGPYVWARAAFGPTVAFAVGWVAYVSALFSSAAVIAGLSEHAGPLFGVTGTPGQRAFAAASVLTLALVVASGLRPSSAVWDGVTILKLIPLLILALLGVAVGSASVTEGPRVLHAGGAWRASLVAVFALQGFEIVAVPARRVRNAVRAVPLATLGSLLSAALLYAAIHWACVRGVPELAGSDAPLVDAARALAGPGLARVVAAGTNVSALGIAFGMMAMTPRYLSALGTDDALGPTVARERREVPVVALAVTAGLVIALCLLGRLGELFVLSSVAVLLQYGMSLASLARLALRGAHGLRPRDALVAPFALGSLLLMGAAAQLAELLVAAAVVAAGFVALAVRRQVVRG